MAFDLVSRKGLFHLLEKIGCPQKVVMSFHEDMKGSVLFDGSSSAVFPIKSGVKQGCVLAPTLFGIFFSLLLSHASSESEDGVFLHTRSDGKLFNLFRLRAKKSAPTPAARDALRRRRCPGLPHRRRTAKTRQLPGSCLQRIRLDHQAPSLSIGDYTLEVVEDFTYLGSTISSNLSLEAEINKRIDKGACGACNTP